MNAHHAPTLTPLQSRVAREIVALVRREDHKAGDHLKEQALAQHIGTSRSPIQAALRHLAALGLLRQDSNRGYFLAKDAQQWEEFAAHVYAKPVDPLYLQIASARLTGQIPQDVSEAELMRRFNVARSTLRKVLARISESGWVEQRVGHGWSFLPMIDSPRAYEENYLFRQTLEPSGLLGPWFHADPCELDALIQEQARIVSGGYESMTATELFEANSRLHETIAKWSGNRFIEQSVRRMNQLRRLVEYRQADKRLARKSQATEHLAILEAIKQQDLLMAAALLKRHLEEARINKVKAVWLFDQEHHD